MESPYCWGLWPRVQGCWLFPGLVPVPIPKATVLLRQPVAIRLASLVPVISLVGLLLA